MADKTPGIKVRVAKDRLVQLVDRETGKWLANVRWRPCGEIAIELAKDVQKQIVNESPLTIGDVTSRANI